MLRYQWEDAARFWNSKKGEELSTGQKVRRLQLFDITHRKKDGSPMTSEAAEVLEKLNDKKAEYEAIASSDSSVHIDDIDNRIITEVLGPERYVRSQVEVQRLREQMAQMQATTVEQITQLKAEAASREAGVQRKYEELQLQLKAEATAREAAAAREAEAVARKAESRPIVAFVEKAPLKLQSSSGVCGKSAAKAAFVKKASLKVPISQTSLKVLIYSDVSEEVPLKVLIYSGIFGENAAKGPDL
ncbi:hypothetical protein GOBAR_AA38449 [Gossypium barbadense]|uniref:Uncharacterized protein n=1 Tax=Gossypium barbadense TaxID=3634 RepID=A0A2P5VTW0_GOSBA|nr:hypothetical protein GOBAR_AA38449 [Gossypium barbadense]